MRIKSGVFDLTETLPLSWIQRNHNLLFFIGGFLFDAVTLNRIDNSLDLILQSVYLGTITGILVLQVRQHLGAWTPHPRLARVWSFNTEALHFLYGGLLSAYVIFYFKSASASRSAVFLMFIAALMVANEMPQVKRLGFRMRLGLHAFCLASYLNYLIPVLFGRMGAWTFALAMLLSLAASAGLVWRLAGWHAHRLRAALTLGWPPAVVFTLLIALYAMKWIPPVPLSLQFIGVYHDVRAENGHYRLLYPKPPWYRFWASQSRPFRARPGDSIHAFVRVFAPTRFRHAIFMEWSVQNSATGQWQVTDRIPLPIQGGRSEGWRGFTAKSRFEPGRWRIEAQTEDSRAIGAVTFRVAADPALTERPMREQRM